MAGGALDNDHDEITDINVTPFVDVMLVLLVIFMATATYVVNQSINVELPSAASGESTPATNLNFVLDRDSNLSLEGQKLTFEDLPKVIEGLRAKSPQGLQALVTADKVTPHGSVVKLIDVIRKNGITEFAINVEVEQK